MNFFQKLASVIGKALQIAGVAAGLIPYIPNQQVQAGVDKAIDSLTSIGGILVMIQTALSGATGADKLKAALPLVVNAVKASEMVSGHQIQDEARFVLGSQEILQGVYDVLNSLKSDGIKTDGQEIKSIAPAATATVKAA